MENILYFVSTIKKEEDCLDTCSIKEATQGFMTACEFGVKNVVKRLIDNGIDVNVQYKDPKPLTVAAENGHSEVTLLLIDSGADVNYTDRWGRNAFMLATLNGHVETAEKLLERGYDINAEVLHGNTPLMLTIVDSKFRNINMLKMLIHLGANVTEKNKHHPNNTALILAAGYNMRDFMEVMLDMGANINEQNSEGKTALMTAVENNNIEAAEFLMQRGADVNIKDSKGRTAIMIHPCEYELSMMLIGYGANVNDKDDDGLSPLMHALKNQRDEKCSLLIENGANIYERDNNKNTVLMYAIKFDSAIIDQILEKGVDVNEINGEGETALIIASQERNLQAAELLLKRNANIHAKTNGGRTALMEAVRGIGNRYYPLLVQTLIQQGGEVNDKDITGMTILMIAIQAGYDEVTRIIIESGANVNEKINGNLNALIMAIMRGNSDIVQLLIEKGATDDVGEDALDFGNNDPNSVHLSGGQQENSQNVHNDPNSVHLSGGEEENSSVQNVHNNLSLLINATVNESKMQYQTMKRQLNGKKQAQNTKCRLAKDQIKIKNTRPVKRNKSLKVDKHAYNLMIKSEHTRKVCKSERKNMLTENELNFTSEQDLTKTDANTRINHRWEKKIKQFHFVGTRRNRWKLKTRTVNPGSWKRKCPPSTRRQMSRNEPIIGHQKSTTKPFDVRKQESVKLLDKLNRKSRKPLDLKKKELRKSHNMPDRKTKKLLDIRIQKSRKPLDIQNKESRLSQNIRDQKTKKPLDILNRHSKKLLEKRNSKSRKPPYKIQSIVNKPPKRMRQKCRILLDRGNNSRATNNAAGLNLDETKCNDIDGRERNQNFLQPTMDDQFRIPPWITSPMRDKQSTHNVRSSQALHLTVIMVKKMNSLTVTGSSYVNINKSNLVFC